jgi:hypothetical protein
MRVLMRSFVLVFLAIVGAVLLALTSTMTSIASAAATQIFAMGGTGHPERGRDQLRRPRLGGHAVDRHSDGGPVGYTKIAIITPEHSGSTPASPI